MENLPQIDWTVVTYANVLYTIAAVGAAVSSTMGWLQSRKNTRIGNESNIKLDENNIKTDVVAARVNGHLTDLQKRWEIACAENASMHRSLEASTAENVRLQTLIETMSKK